MPATTMQAASSSVVASRVDRGRVVAGKESGRKAGPGAAARDGAGDYAIDACGRRSLRAGVMAAGSGLSARAAGQPSLRCGLGLGPDLELAVLGGMHEVFVRGEKREAVPDA